MKFICFSDLHLNKFPYSNITKTGENELLMAGLGIIDQVYQYAIEHGINYVFFLGDLFHIRAKIDSDIYSNMVYDKFCQYFGEKDSPNLILIPGNHDQIDKSGKHTLLPYSKIMNVTVMSSLYKHGNLIFCPHQYKIGGLYDYLIANSDDKSIVFMHQLIVNSPVMSGAVFRKNEDIDISKFKYRCIFSGHNHRPFENKDLRVYNIGSPMHISHSDSEVQERYFIVYDNGDINWIKTKFPRFANKGTNEAKDASYIRNVNKKVKQIDERINLNFSDDISNILNAYLLNTNCNNLDKDALLREGVRLIQG